MSSLIFNSALAAALSGRIDFKADTFKVMLCTGDYEPDKSHASRADITNEIAGPGYTKGGTPVPVKVSGENNRIDVILGGAKWARATMTARKAVYYKSSGGAPEGDELVAVIDFGSDITSTYGSFELTSSILRVQN